MLRIAITDDHTIFRKSSALLINNFAGMEVLLEAANGIELLDKLKHTTIDILLLDIQMPVMNGFETCQKINEIYPSIKILVLTFKNDADTIKKIIELQVQGYFTKNTDPLELNNAIHRLDQEGFYFEKNLSAAVQQILKEDNNHNTSNYKAHLTEREMDIVRLTLEENNGKETADKLNISPRTVEKHKRNLMIKTNSKNFIGVIIYVLSHNFISLNDLQ